MQGKHIFIQSSCTELHELSYYCRRNPIVFIWITLITRFNFFFKKKNFTHVVFALKTFGVVSIVQYFFIQSTFFDQTLLFFKKIIFYFINPYRCRMRSRISFIQKQNWNMKVALFKISIADSLGVNLIRYKIYKFAETWRRLYHRCKKQYRA